VKGHKGVAVLAVALCLALSFLGTAESAIPKKGAIVVLVKGPSQKHVESATAIIIRELKAKGYNVVDQKRRDAIRSSKAAALALDGNVEAIMKLGSQFGFSTFIGVHAEADEPRMNEFELYTGTATLSFVATSSNGNHIGGDTFSAKQVGYSIAEAEQKSLEAAAKIATAKLTE
jgi:hypothetical protein